MIEKVRYDESHIYYETFDHNNHLIKRVVCPVSYADKIIAESKGPFRTLTPTVMLRTLTVTQFLNSIR